MQEITFEKYYEGEEGEGNAGNKGIDDDADADGDEDKEDRYRDDDGKTTAHAMKQTSLERNDSEEEGDVGQGDEKMKTTMSTKVTKTMENDVGRETAWADS